MAYLKRPQAGERVLQSLYDSVNSIIDYLPSLTVRGDNNSTYVEHTGAGTVIHVKKNVSPDQGGGGREYYAGSGLTLSGNVFYNALSGDGVTTIIVDNVISAAGGTGGTPPANGRFNTIGFGNSVNSTLSGGGTVAAGLSLSMQDPPPDYYITINETADANGYNIISCSLTSLEQLYNDYLVTNVHASSPTVNYDHHMKAEDWFFNSGYGNKGLGTQIGLYRYSTGNTVIDPQTGEAHLVNPVMGLKVDLTLTGGTWIGTSATTRMNYGFEVDPEDLQINCLLTGTYDHSPHTSGFIDIVPTIMEDGQTWGVISTNLHAGSGIAIDEQTGEISVTGAVAPSPGGSGSGFIPNWGHSNHSDVIRPTSYIPDTPISTAHAGYLWAWASFEPSQQNYRFDSAQAHVVINGAWMKVAEISYPQKFYIELSGTRYERNVYGDFTNQVVVNGSFTDEEGDYQTVSNSNYYRDDGKDYYNDDDSQWTYFAWTRSATPSPGMPSAIYTQNYYIHTDGSYSVYFKRITLYDENENELTSYLDGTGFNRGEFLQSIGYNGSWDEQQSFERQWDLNAKASNVIAYACWQNTSDSSEVVYTNGKVQKDSWVYQLTEVEGRGQMYRKEDSNDEYMNVTDTNAKMQAIGVGAGVCIPFRKGVAISYVVNYGGGFTSPVPQNYGQPEMGSAPPAACILYYDEND